MAGLWRRPGFFPRETCFIFCFYLLLEIHVELEHLLVRVKNTENLSSWYLNGWSFIHQRLGAHFWEEVKDGWGPQEQKLGEWFLYWTDKHNVLENSATVVCMVLEMWKRRFQSHWDLAATLADWCQSRDEYFTTKYSKHISLDFSISEEKKSICFAIFASFGNPNLFSPNHVLKQDRHYSFNEILTAFNCRTLTATLGL